MEDRSKAEKNLMHDGIEIYSWTDLSKDHDGRFVVFHPGASMDHSSMLPLQRLFYDAGFNTVLYDPQGVGYSDKPDSSSDYSLDNYSSGLERIVGSKGISKPILVGHSAGFMVIVDYASRTDNANKVVGICGTNDIFSSMSIGIAALRKVLRPLEYVGSAYCGLKRALSGDEQGCADQSELEGRSDLAVWLSIVDVPLYDLRKFSLSGNSMISWNITPQLSNIGCQVVLIYGLDDRLVVPDIGFFVKEIVPSRYHSVIEYLDGTHTLPFVKPRAVFNAIHKYLN